MATKIKGITIELNGDTSKLEKSLRSTNSQISQTQKELKDVEKLLKLDPTNTELLAQKQKLLADNVSNVSQKLEELTELEKAMKDAGVDENSAQFMALRREIIETSDKLKEAERNAKGFNATLAEASAQAQKLSDATGAVAEKTKGLSAVAGGVVAGIGGLAIKAGQTADELNTLSKQTGISTADLQKFQFASEMVDVSTEDMVSALTKLKKNMTSSSASTVEAFNKIGVATKNADGTFRDATDVFNDTIKALSTIQNETEKDTIAMTLFGKGADSLAGIIDDGGQALKAFGDQAEEMGLILSQDTLNSLNEVNDKIDTLKATATATLTEVGAKAMDALLPVIEDIINAVADVLEWVGNLDEGTIRMITTIAGVIALISPVAGIISKISGAVSGFLAFLPTLQTAFSAVSSFAMANPMLLIAGAIIALVALIILNWDKIKAVLDEIWTKTKEVFQGIKDTISEIIGGIVQFIKDKINGVIGVINGLIGGINKAINALNKFKVDIPEWFPLIGGKSFGFNIPNIKEIPMLANGGTLTRGSAIVGEAGAELLTMANGRANVQPLTNNVTNNTYNQLSSNPIEVMLNLDGKTLSRELVAPMASAQRLRGGSCIV